MLKESVKREVSASQQQIAELIAVLPPAVSDIVEFAVYTGFRKEIILSLRIEDVTLHDIGPTGEARLTVKGGRRETYPLGENAVRILRQAKGERQEGYVFLNPRTNNRYYSLGNTFDRAVRKMDLKVDGTKFRFHDLRHVFATWLYQAGVSLDMIRPRMYHRDRSTTDRYATIDRKAAGEVLVQMPTIKKLQPPDRSSSKELARIGKVVY